MNVEQVSYKANIQQIGRDRLFTQLCRIALKGNDYKESRKNTVTIYASQKRESSNCLFYSIRTRKPGITKFICFVTELANILG